MTEVTFHPVPRLGRVVAEQLRSVGLSLRIAAAVLAAILAFGTVLIVRDMLGGGPGFDSYETFPTAVIAFLFPFAVWRGEKRFGADFLWTLPVERRRLAFARVFAGWIWLMAAIALFALWLLTLGLFAHTTLSHTIMRIPLVPTMTTYLLGSAVVLGLRYPLRWLAGIAAGFLLLANISPRLESTLTGWPADTSPMTTLLWLGAGLAALWAAASRHRERRRR